MQRCPTCEDLHKNETGSIWHTKISHEGPIANVKTIENQQQVATMNCTKRSSKSTSGQQLSKHFQTIPPKLVKRCEKMWKDVKRCEKMWKDVKRCEKNFSGHSFSILKPSSNWLVIGALSVNVQFFTDSLFKSAPASWTYPHPRGPRSNSLAGRCPSPWGRFFGRQNCPWLQELTIKQWFSRKKRDLRWLGHQWGSARKGIQP